MVGNTLVVRVSRLLGLPFAIWFAASCVLTGMMPVLAFAQSNAIPDFESPIIEHTVLGGGQLGSVEVFGATVVDNDEISGVTLFYRFSGENEFAEVQMREIASSSFYSAKVDTANVPIGTESIQYYLQAVDASGNLVLKGFAFQPLERFFEPESDPVVMSQPTPATTQEPEIVTSEKAGINWWYVGLGVLAVGAIAGAAGGSDGGGSSNDCVGGCDVTVTFSRP